MIRFRSFLLLHCAAVAYSDAAAQTLSGSLRARGEWWRWFDHAVANNTYNYAGALLRVAVADQKPRFAWRIEVGAPLLLGLPDDAVAAHPADSWAPARLIGRRMTAVRTPPAFF